MNPAGDLRYQPLCTLGNFENILPGKKSVIQSLHNTSGELFRKTP